MVVNSVQQAVFSKEAHTTLHCFWTHRWPREVAAGLHSRVDQTHLVLGGALRRRKRACFCHACASHLEPTHVAFRGSKVRCRKPEVITEGKKAAKPSCVGRAAGKPADSRGKKQVKNV
ncbi:probable G-protein coupled receptor 160 isoform X3 [Tupaia chinensis]|uniref:probable G-protein coupled receptor 160 isoform X3 n=1 Tax=Tupaia chinensis TaxID=246437 RepID=UPI0007041AC8|nr:probable G-protein coupled receptor 160 isoform X3 [Tupaia chinensis]XP_014437747.1 probable G-protein coupled receptor 160 isoform X3 [Tupaia chinensis]